MRHKPPSVARQHLRIEVAAERPQAPGERLDDTFRAIGENKRAGWSGMALFATAIAHDLPQHLPQAIPSK
jgi:hypothetical protein